jgi:hypothetical protein
MMMFNPRKPVQRGDLEHYYLRLVQRGLFC